jgi:hypothetical protein
MAAIRSTDPRKPAIKAKLIALAGGGSKVTFLSESKQTGQITGHVLAKVPGQRGWKSLGYFNFPAADLEPPAK